MVRDRTLIVRKHRYDGPVVFLPTQTYTDLKFYRRKRTRIQTLLQMSKMVTEREYDRGSERGVGKVPNPLCSTEGSRTQRTERSPF